MRAIGIGAPLYNAGDVASCFRTYLHTAEELCTSAVAHIRPQASEPPRQLRDWLGPIADQARREGDREGAWTLRYAFDALLAQP